MRCAAGRGGSGVVGRPVLGKTLRAAENVCREERLVAQAEEIGLI